MRVEVGAVTDIGRIREVNEDSLLIEAPLYAVADGMGGHRGGDVASSLALETVEAMSRRGEGSLADRVREANRAVHDRSEADRTVSGMGTTLTAVTVEEGAARLAHVGDSRAYLLRAGDLRQITADHTLVARMVKAGEITREEAAVHPHRNVVTRALGTEGSVQVDETTVPLLDGDRLLLCSDGLTGMVQEDQIQAILEAEPSPQRAADRLVKAANRAGGIDNITVVVLEAHAEEGDAVPGSRPRPQRPSARRVIAGVLVGLVVIAGVLVGVKVYVDRQWYVGESEGSVAVYQGIPARPFGISLSDVSARFDDLPVEDVTALEVYGDLTAGIAVESESEALARVEQMRTDLEEQAAAEANDRPSTDDAGGGGGGTGDDGGDGAGGGGTGGGGGGAG